MILTGSVLANDVQRSALLAVLQRHGLELSMHDKGAPIPATYWGEPEAGLRGNQVHARADTPLHSLLHEACHAICMDDMRRQRLDRDAGGDDLEECAVCFLQLVIADQIPDIGWRSVACDMDAWGYSFRAGSTASWFLTDANDAQQWLIKHRVLSPVTSELSA
ncbi:MAG: hypothetical protein AAF270_02390 [Pseudomonadota bacterium]